MKKLIPIFLSLIFLFFPFRKLWVDGRMFAWGDNQPFPVSSEQAFDAFFSAWQPMSRGIDNPQNVTLFLQGVLIKFFFENAKLAQKFYLFFPFSFSFLCSYLLLSLLTKKTLPRILAAFFYAFNPATFGAFIGGAMGMLYVHALLPPAYFLSIKSFSTNPLDKKVLKFLLLSLVFSFLFYFGTIYAMILALLPSAYYFLKFLRVKEYGKAAVCVLISGIASVFTFFLSLPFSFYLLGWVGGGLVGQSLSLASGSLKAELLGNYSRALVDNIGLTGTYNVFPFLSPLRFFGFFITLFVFGPLVFWKKIAESRKELLKVSLSASFFLWFLVFLTSRGFTVPIFEKIPALFVFRSPAKLVLFVALPYSFLLCQFFESAGDAFKLRSRCFFYAAVLAIFLFYSFPFFEGGIFLKHTKASLAPYAIPESFDKVSLWLGEKRKIQGEFRTLWLPFAYESEEIKIRFLDEANLSLPLGLSQFLSFEDNFLGRAYDLICRSSPEDLGSFLAPFSTRFVIVNTASKERSPCTSDDHYLLSDPEILIAYLDGQKNLARAAEFDDLVVYENKKWQSKVVFFKRDLSSLEDVRMGEVVGEGSTISRKKGEILVKNIPGGARAVFLSEFYHKNWTAYAGGKKLPHMEGSGFGNFFVRDTGSGDIKGDLIFRFEDQKLRDNLMAIWSVSVCVWWGIFLFRLLPNPFKK